MLKAYSRTHVDLSFSESVTSLLQLLNPISGCSNSNVHQLEEEFADYIGKKYAVAFPYCRTGMYFSLKALELTPGSEVILPAFTFWVDAAMVVLAGYKPVFVDVDFATLSMDPKKIEEKITSKTKIIFPTHLNGLAADMDPIIVIAKKYNLRVIEDCARSCGILYKDKRVGSFDIGTFSFGYGKSFYDFGGAMVASDDETFINALREEKKRFKRIAIKDLYRQTLKGVILRYMNTPYLYRFSLYPMVYKFQVEGREEYASRFRVKMLPYENVPDNFLVDMNNLQVKIGLSQLKKIDQRNKKRLENADILNKELAGIEGISIPSSTKERKNVAVHYAVWSDKKKALQAFLTKSGIDTQDESAIDTTQLDRFKKYVAGDFPNARKLDGKVIFLPTHAYLNKKDMLFIASKVKEFFRA